MQSAVNMPLGCLKKCASKPGLSPAVAEGSGRHLVRGSPSAVPIFSGSGEMETSPMFGRLLDYDQAAVVVLIFGIGGVLLLALSI